MTDDAPGALPEYILTLTCKDRPGIVAGVASALATAGCNIEESSQFGDPESGRFFMRVRFSSPPNLNGAEVEGALVPVAKRFSMDWCLAPADRPMRTLIMVSRQDHCLNDLLYRCRIGSLNLEITRVVSNHERTRGLAEQAGLAFSHLPVRPETRERQEARLLELVEKDGAELIVLARYMQILSDGLATRLAGRVINIHHSFLPSFKGARPYHQAHARGVKLIGATAHYVTPELDEGPIIEQETERVDHAMSVRDLVNAGRDIERRVLARAVRYHSEHRVLINGRKTVVFR